MTKTQGDSDKGRKAHSIFYYVIVIFTLLAVGTGTVLCSASFTLNAWRALNVRARTNAQAQPDSAQQGKRSGAPTVHATPQQANTSSTSDSMALLSANLSTYLPRLDPNVGVEVYDLTNQHSYTHNNSARFLTGSSAKVPIMFAFLAMTEKQNRQPDADEMNLLTTMIENSDNDSATALYNEINDAAGLSSYLQQIGVSGLEPDNDAWGYSLITPHAMVNLLTQLYNGTILTANDRAMAFHLMQNIESDQRWGVGDTAPAGATVSMKNGWLPGPDGLWTVNTSGIVTVNGITYIVSVYTQEQASLAAGQSIVQTVCGDVTSAFTAHKMS